MEIISNHIIIPTVLMKLHMLIHYVLTGLEKKFTAVVMEK